jgi:ribosomal protein S18 acetylase RimI-like enzyme
MQKPLLQFEEIELARITRIKPLWEKLNALHYEESVYFKDHYASFTFEKRMEGIVVRNSSQVKITLVSESGSARGYCLSTVDGANGEIDSLYLDADLRGCGVGRKLMQLHVDWLKEKACKRIRLSVSYGHEDVVAFYHKLGFYERLITLEYKGDDIADGISG